VFDAIQTQFTWVVKQTLALLALTFQCPLLAILLARVGANENKMSHAA
jgi:hypothetical protein